MFLTKPTWQAYKSLLARPIRELDDFQNLDPTRQRHLLAARLLAQIRYFGTREDALPEWRDAARIQAPGELWKIWPSLPIVTKQVLNTAFEPSETQHRFGLRGRIGMTGGSTGEPTRFFLDTPMLRASRGSHFYSRIRMGWKPGMPTIIVWGSERDIGKQAKPWYRLAHALYGDRMVPGFEIDDRSVSGIHAIMRAESPVAIYGFSSLMEYVAERTLSMRATLPAGSVAAAWNGGEMLYDNQVDLFKSAFGVPILNRYGGRELSVTAFQNAAGAPLRMLRPWLFLEIVDDSGAPAAPGQPGRLILTSTICRGTPFLRYEVGDLGAYSANDMDESGIHSIRELCGRHSGAIRLNDGRVISALYWHHLLKDYPEVRQFQVRVKREGRLSVLLVGLGFTADRLEHLVSAVRVLWGEHPVEFIWTDSIPKSPQGKLVQVVHEP